MRPHSLALLHLAVFSAAGLVACSLHLDQREECFTRADEDELSAKGFVEARPGVINRQKAVAASKARDTCCVRNALGVLHDGCRFGSSCGGGEVCAFSGDPEGGCFCREVCETDEDCNEGQACIAPSELIPIEFATCVPAGCRTNDDCASGECGLSMYHDGCGLVLALACRSEMDECQSDEECTGSTGDYACQADSGSGPWTCIDQPDCAIGRPFLIANEARLAPSLIRDGWGFEWKHHDKADNDRVFMSAKQRMQMAQVWCNIGVREHASIASFSRFILDLMALAAPADLLVQSVAAMNDEIRHAQLAFDLAGYFSGQSHGPGELPIRDALAESSRHDFLRRLIIEGCVGETIAVARTIAALHDVENARVRSVLLTIIEDETRHSALAWRTLTWFLSTASIDEYAAAEQIFNCTISENEDDILVADRCGDESGLSGVQRARALAAQSVQSIIRPAMRAVLARRSYGFAQVEGSEVS